MKYIKQYSILISIALFGLTSCIKEVEFSGEETAPMPVLNCMVAHGDTVVYADLSKSLFFLRRGDFAPLTDAEVTLTCNGTPYLMTLVGDSVYRLRHTFASGDVVAISAVVPEFGTLTSETMAVTTAPTIADAYIEHGDEEWEQSFTLKILNPNPGGTYYQISVYRDSVMDALDNPNESLSCYDSRLLLTNTDFPSVNYGRFLAFPAANISGDTCTLVIDLGSTPMSNFNYYVEVTSVSESLYKYLSTMENYLGSRGNPFTEPVQVYTNISGGLGVFGTKNKSERKIDFRMR